MTTNADTEARASLDKLCDASIPIELRQRLFAELRQRPELSAPVDRALLLRDKAQSDAIAELGEVVDGLRQLTEKLSSAPLHEGVFVEACDLPDGKRLARVISVGRETLLEVVDDSIFETLRAGDRVLLATERNAVLGKAMPAPAGAGECAMVERWLDDVDDARLVVRHRDQSLIVRAAAALSPENLQPGETVLLDPASGFAMERVPSDDKSAYAPIDEATSLQPEALAGYDDIRDGTLRRISSAVAHPDVAALYGMGQRRPWILLGGPPGNGKTTLARVLAGDLQRQTGRHCRIRKINGGELLSAYVGETEARIRALLREVRDSDQLSIIFIDEVEAVARTRGASGNVHSDRFLSTWLAELEGFEGRAPCIVVAATNRLDMLDAAFRSRFSTEIEVPRPRMEAARAIFAVHLGTDLPYDPGSGDAEQTRQRMIDLAVARLYLPNAPGALLATLRLRDGKARKVFARDLISGRLIEQICVDARERAFQRHVDGEHCGLRVEDIDAATDAARDRLRATLTPANAHSHLTDLPQDASVVGVDPAPRVHGGVSFIREAA